LNNPILKIDDEGFLLQNQTRLTDPAFGKPILESLFVRGRVYWTKWDNREIRIECFDAPLVAQGISRDGQKLLAHLPYGLDKTIEPSALRVDEWDRFHVVTAGEPPMVLSRKAQVQLFDLLDGFDDESIEFAGRKFAVKSYLPNSNDAASAEFWDSQYRQWQATGDSPGWDLNSPSPFLHDILPQLKILKQRVAVLGCGAGHDAAYFASLGHIVTAFDISPSAIATAQKTHPESKNLRYVQMDLLSPREDMFGQFDLVFEHTFFCAINPVDRPKAIATMHKLLSVQGHLLANFFVIDPEPGPPFGATEWELRKRFEKKFHPLYWTRWQKSIERRMGWELIVYAQKKNYL
jgi:SAM-dependent methyltransferase